MVDHIDISVIVPAFNAERHITETLRSILAALDHDFSSEIIFVDNGSTDATVSLATSILSTSTVPAQIIFEPTRGPSPARNRGVMEAKGVWLQFIDSDDFIGTQKIRSQLDFAARHSDVSCIYSEWARVDSAGSSMLSIETPSVRQTGVEAAVDLLQDGNFIQIGSQIVKRAEFLRVGGFTQERLIEDVELLMRLAVSGCRFAFCQMNQPGLFYRQHTASLSRSDPIGFALAIVRNARLLLHAAADSNALDNSVLNTVANGYTQALRMLAGADWETFLVVNKERRAREIPLVFSTAGIRWASSILGYETAEFLAAFYRSRIKPTLRIR